MKERDHFTEKKVFTTVNQEVARKRLAELGKRPIQAKWIFKKKVKVDGTLEAKGRCVAKGYTQVEGLNYKDAFSPVVNEVATRVVFAVGLHKGYVNQVYDVNAAFLNGDLEE